MSSPERYFLCSYLASKVNSRVNLAGEHHYLYPKGWISRVSACVCNTLTYPSSRCIVYPSLTSEISHGDRVAKCTQVCPLWAYSLHHCLQPVQPADWLRQGKLGNYGIQGPVKHFGSKALWVPEEYTKVNCWGRLTEYTAIYGGLSIGRGKRGIQTRVVYCRTNRLLSRRKIKKKTIKPYLTKRNLCFRNSGKLNRMDTI